MTCSCSVSPSLLPSPPFPPLLPPSSQEFEYWVKRNPKILDTLLSFRSYDSRGTLGPLLLTAADSDSLDSTVSVPLHSLSRDELRGSPLPHPFSSPHQHSLTTPPSTRPLEVTHTMRPIRSEPALVSMVTHTQPPLLTQSISEENLGSAVTAERSEAPAVEKEAPPTSPLAVKMGASSPTLSQVASESDTIVQSGMGTLEPSATVTESEEFLKSVSLGSQAGSKETSMEVKFTTEPLPEEEEEEKEKEEEEEEKEGTKEKMEGEEGEVGGGEGKGRGEKGGEGQDSEEPHKAAGEVGGKEEEEEEVDDGGKVLDQGGSIMQSEELPPMDLNLDLPEELQQESAPSSPLLPTTMETVALELQQLEGEEEEEEKKDEEEEKEEEEGEEGLEEGGEPLSIKSDGISEGVELREGLLLPTSESAPEVPTGPAGEAMATNMGPPQVTVGFSVEQQLEQGEHQIEQQQNGGHQLEP